MVSSVFAQLKILTVVCLVARLNGQSGINRDNLIAHFNAG